ncbi:UPF0711 protein C18orf21 homolog isoform X2 [Callorhinchus milii]|uniref:Uncharacterized protein n=1 Tax=Callorhinchus milii TaxID=7868 RepID=V9KLC3_CALMI|nr:UPF0711 protein C18orf21 homolog isoform X2 [Callorhinchus milii]|eukprot:gi/632968936/ref/XP_007900809.1/ PREDICTED: UPF0711 protein C18orf21 homolog isoform X2 [Callorhinchus milii]
MNAELNELKTLPCGRGLVQNSINVQQWLRLAPPHSAILSIQTLWVHLLSLEPPFSSAFHPYRLQILNMATFISLVTCYTCNETSRCYGANRAALIAASGRLARSKLGAKAPEVQRHQQTPGLAMGYSQHLNKPGSKGKNPTTAPRTFTSTPSTSSAPLLKSVKAKKLHCSRLKMLLNCEQKQPSKKGTLKDFLSSV